MLTWVLGPHHVEMPSQALTDSHKVPRIGTVRKIPQLEKSQGLLSPLV